MNLFDRRFIVGCLASWLCAQADARTECATDAAEPFQQGCIQSAPTQEQTVADAKPMAKTPASQELPLPEQATLALIPETPFAASAYCQFAPAVAPEWGGASESLIDITADDAQLLPANQIALLTGQVSLRQDAQEVHAGALRLDRLNSLIATRGPTLFQRPGLQLWGKDGVFDYQKKTGSLAQVDYQLLTAYATRGQADQVDIQDPEHLAFRELNYTTCPPNSTGWSLKAERLTLDRIQGEGEAYDARVYLGDVPILYTPYLNFPIDDRRKSGFLPPHAGFSEHTGLDLSLPYYFNIAPNLDATFQPRLMTEHGLMLGGEMRFLTETQQGRLRGQILPDDPAQDGDTRGGLSFQHRGRWNDQWSSELNINHVSDKTYLGDFGNDLNVTSGRNLEQRGDLRYRQGPWSFLGRVQSFQTLDASIAPQDRPYRRLPQLYVGYGQDDLLNLPLSFKFDSEYDYFDHDHNVRGQRINLRSSLAMPIRNSYSFVIPKATANYVGYDLTGQTMGAPDNPEVFLPTLSLDSGLVFERQSQWFAAPLTQTLEPRLFYVYTPYADQHDQPLFDTDQLDFNSFSMFRENRFSGRDRIGDANQLTLGLTTRGYRTRDGAQLYDATIGEILFFQNRKVTIDDEPERSDRSLMAFESGARLLDDWHARLGLYWDPERSSNTIQRSQVQLTYEATDRQWLTLGYRFNRGTLVGAEQSTGFEDVNLGFRVPIDERWELLGRWYYSLLHDTSMDRFAGVQYTSCCWRLQGVVREFKNQADADPNLGVMFQIELKGLGRFGDDIGRFLEDRLFGYREES